MSSYSHLISGSSVPSTVYYWFATMIVSISGNSIILPSQLLPLLIVIVSMFHKTVCSLLQNCQPSSFFPVFPIFITLCTSTFTSFRLYFNCVHIVYSFFLIFVVPRLSTNTLSLIVDWWNYSYLLYICVLLYGPILFLLVLDYLLIIMITADDSYEINCI